MADSAALSDSARDALGYLGGCILALSLVPQVIKLLLTRSAADISLMWSLLYLLGSALSFIYLVLLGAVAAWVPIVVELCGCLATISLKLLFDHTHWGRNQELLLELELDAQQPEAAAAAAPAIAAAAGNVAKDAVPAVVEAGEVAVDVLLPAEQQGQGQDGKQPQPAAGKQQLLPTSVAAPAQQQQQHPTLRQRTKKRVMLAAPLTAAEAAEAAAAVASGDIVLKLGLQLPHNPLQRGSLNSAGSTAASTPRGDASGVVFYDSSEGAGSRGGPRWGSRTASARKVPWYLQTGISHHSVLPPASPRQAAAVAAAATAATAATVPAPDSPRKSGTVPATAPGSAAASAAAAGCCCPHCGMPAQQQQQRQQLSIVAGPSGRAFSNSLFSPTGSSPEVTPRRGGFLMRRQWRLFGRDAGAAAGDRQQEVTGTSGAAEGLGATSAPFHT